MALKPPDAAPDFTTTLSGSKNSHLSSALLAVMPFVGVAALASAKFAGGAFFFFVGGLGLMSVIFFFACDAFFFTGDTSLMVFSLPGKSGGMNGSGGCFFVVAMDSVKTRKGFFSSSMISMISIISSAWKP